MYIDAGKNEGAVLFNPLPPSPAEQIPKVLSHSSIHSSTGLA